MGSNHKYLVFQAPVLVLLHIPALIEIAAICSGKVGGIVDDGRALALEKLVQFQVGLCVNGVPQKLGKKCTEHGLAINFNALFLKIPGNISERGFRLSVHLKHQLYMVGGYGIGNHFLCADALYHRRLQLVAIGGLPAHVEAFQAPGIVGIRDTLLDCLAFKLGEYNADIQHGPSHRG